MRCLSGIVGCRDPDHPVESPVRTLRRVFSPFTYIHVAFSVSIPCTAVTAPNETLISIDISAIPSRPVTTELDGPGILLYRNGHVVLGKHILAVRGFAVAAVATLLESSSGECYIPLSVPSLSQSVTSIQQGSPDPTYRKGGGVHTGAEIPAGDP